MRAVASGQMPSARRLAAATLARCYVCQTDGPIDRLAEHLREDHALSGEALRAAFTASTQRERTETRG